MNDIKTVCIQDERIANITDQIYYAVESGGSEYTQQYVVANSASPSALNFQIQVPSENIVIDRRVLMNATVYFTVVCQYNVPVITVSQNLFNLGVSECLSCMPLNSLFLTSSASINNSNVSVNLQDVKDQILRLNTDEQIMQYNNMSPNLPDHAYCLFPSALNTTVSAPISSTNNPILSYNNSGYNNRYKPRGAWSINTESASLTYTTAGGTNTVNPLNVNGSGNSIGFNTITTATANGATAPIAGFQTLTIAFSVTLTEPLLGLSPFTFIESEYNSQGLVGIQNMSLTFNLDSNCNKFLNTSNYTILSPNPQSNGSYIQPTYIQSVRLGTTAQPSGWSNCQLLLNYLSLDPTQIVPIKNVCPYQNISRFLTPSNNSKLLPAWNNIITTLTTNATTLVSSNLQLNQVSDLIIIGIRVPMSQQSYASTATFLTINSISINFNNKSGILANSSAYELWQGSIKNGSNQTWEEFQGYQSISTTNGVSRLVGTSGSLLVLNPAMQFGLPSFLSSGSIGNYNFQFNINVSNQYSYNIQPEIVVMTVDSGIFVTETGQSNIYNSLLTKELTLKTKEEKSVDPITRIQYQRLVGGAMHKIKTSVKKLHHRRHHMLGSGHPGSGGGHSGSGGAMMHKKTSLSHLLK